MAAQGKKHPFFCCRTGLLQKMNVSAEFVLLPAASPKLLDKGSLLCITNLTHQGAFILQACPFLCETTNSRTEQSEMDRVCPFCLRCCAVYPELWATGAWKRLSLLTCITWWQSGSHRGSLTTATLLDLSPTPSWTTTQSKISTSEEITSLQWSYID